MDNEILNDVEQSEVKNFVENMDGKDACQGTCPQSNVDDSTCVKELQDHLGDDLGTFKSSAELLKGYRNLRTIFVRQSQELAALKRSGVIHAAECSPEKTCLDNDNASVAHSLTVNCAEQNSNYVSDGSVAVSDYLRSLVAKREVPKVIGITSVELAPKDSAKSISNAVLRAKDYFAARTVVHK